MERCWPPAPPTVVVRLWDTGSANVVRTSAGPLRLLSTTLLSARMEGCWRLPVATTPLASGMWRTGRELTGLEGHVDQVYHLAFSHDGAPGHRLGGPDGEDLGCEHRPGTAHLGPHGDAVQSIAFSPATPNWPRPVGTARRASGTPRTGTLQLALGGHGDKVKDAAYSPDGQKLATVGDDGTLRLYLTRYEDLMAWRASAFSAVGPGGVPDLPEGPTLSNGFECNTGVK